MTQTLLLLHAASTLAMAGLIWFVQVVHYPLFDRAQRGEFAAFAASHQRRTTWVVGPLMLVEVVTAGGLLLQAPAGQRGWLVAGAVLLAIIWLSTAMLQVPQHRRLSSGFDAAAHRRLVRSNWIRAVAWTARGAIALRLLI